MFNENVIDLFSKKNKIYFSSEEKPTRVAQRKLVIPLQPL